MIQYMITIENTGHSKNNERESKADKNSRGPIRPDVNGTQRPVWGTAREIKEGNKIMNIVIGSTIQTFEQENEEIWHLKEIKRD